MNSRRFKKQLLSQSTTRQIPRENAFKTSKMATKSAPAAGAVRASSSKNSQAPAHITSRTSNTPSSITTTSNEQLIFEKKNTDLLHIPRNYRVQKRPIPRAPVASPYAGSHVPKIVYISSKTPFMSAVKRVQKLLRLAERRAMTPVIEGRQARKQNSQQQRNGNRAGWRGGEGDKNILEKCQQKLRQDKVLVKATGRAIEKALEVGKWFELGKGGDDEYEVVVKTGTVCVVDDIVEEEGLEDEDKDEDHDEDKDTVMNNDNHDTTAASTENNLDVESGNDATTGNEGNDEGKEESKDVPPLQGSSENTTTESKNQRRRRRKRERVQQQRLNAFKDEDGDPPESRTRWVNMVEIAINLK